MAQFMFKEAKESFLEGIKELMDIRKLTVDDPSYNAKIKTRITEVMDRAELCKKHYETQFKPKNKAGF